MINKFFGFFTMDFHHISVLENTLIQQLNIKPDDFIVDCTGGGGGHSAKIIKKITQNGRLIIIDQDLEACEHLKQRFHQELIDKNIIIEQQYWVKN